MSYSLNILFVCIYHSLISFSYFVLLGWFFVCLYLPLAYLLFLFRAPWLVFRPLPHVRGSRNYSPTGNPVYARDMLLFPAEGDNCKLGKKKGHPIIVFSRK